MLAQGGAVFQQIGAERYRDTSLTLVPMVVGSREPRRQENPEEITI